MQKLREKDPEKIGPYTLIARLGSGGMGTVFLGSEGTKNVAIKVAREGFLDDPGLRTRFEREIATLERMNSPYIAKFLGAAIEEDIAWHAVEFVNGPTLADKVGHEGPLNPKDWFLLADEVRFALNDVHSAGIVHRDLKPSNIIVSEVGAKLIDFGIAWDSDQTSVTSTGMVTGSPAWLAPEQLDGLDVSPATDLFSAGSVLMFAATGRSPWGNTSTTSVSAMMARIASHKADLTGLDSDQQNIVEGLLQAKPEERTWGNLRDAPPRDMHSPVLPQARKEPTAKQLDTKDPGRGASDGSSASPARDFFKTIRWPAIPWAIALTLFAFSTNALLNLLTVALLLTSLIWLIRQTFTFFRRYGASAPWLSLLVAIPGWVVVTFVGMLLMSALFWR